MLNITSCNQSLYEKTTKKSELLTFYIVYTLNGNFKLKQKLGSFDQLEMEIYAANLESAKQQFKQHLKELKAEGLA